jgi:hypothetical protein
MIESKYYTGGVFGHQTIEKGITEMIEYVEAKTGISEIVEIKINSVRVNNAGVAYELRMEYKPKEKPVDWSKVPVDTKIEYVIAEGRMIKFGYFAGIRCGLPAVWDDGSTEWSSDGCFTIPHKIKLADATE